MLDLIIIRKIKKARYLTMCPGPKQRALIRTGAPHVLQVSDEQCITLTVH